MTTVESLIIINEILRAILMDSIPVPGSKMSEKKMLNSLKICQEKSDGKKINRTTDRLCAPSSRGGDTHLDNNPQDGSK